SGVAVVAKDITCHSGNAARGQLNFKVKDGYAPYTYIVKNVANTMVQGAQAVPANKIATYLTATPGAYTIEVTDSKGCKVSGTATLTAAVRPTVAVVSTTAVVCYGANDGTISLTISGGTAPYKISIDGGTQQNVTGNQHRFTGVTGGNHTVRITDARECYNDITVTVAAPAAPLRGFAVVSELIGCGDTDGDPAHKNKGKVRFTNVSGGHGAPYSYKFDGNFDVYSEGWLPAGTHTVTVRDKAGCELDISVEVPKRIDPPTGTTYTITSYDCDGKGTIRISGLPSTYSYTYTIGGKTATGTTATITGLTPGSYTMTISYTQAPALDTNVLFVENFGSGPKTALPAGRTGLPYGGMGVGYYEITNASLFNTDYAGGSAGCGKKLISATCAANHVWVPVLDHTSGGTDPNGRFFGTNAKSVVADGELFYRREVTDVKPFSNIKWEFYILNLFREDEKMCGTTDAIKPNIRVQLMDSNNHRIGNPVNTGEVPNSICGAGIANWRKYEGTLNVGNNTSFTIEFRSNGSTLHTWANDFLIDDIKVYQVPKSCPQEIVKTVVIPSGQEFKASVLSQTNVTCKGSSTGKVTFKLENLRGGRY
ncbi:SprB repeat-containing protein, partial [Capnocytophaga leadbetteri]|uniref:SprB repeat-containing protein n=1 Tax=Capnocytophaga leadbetteri TaxID=327575 RepID=UPI003C6FB058